MLRTRETRGESPQAPRPDGLSAQAAESQGERRRPPDLGLELHRVERRCQAGQPRARLPREVESRLVAFHEDHLQSCTGTERAELGYEEQPLRIGGERPQPIAQLLPHHPNLPRRTSAPPPPVPLQP